MPFRYWPEHPGERRCVNCDQRLIEEPERPHAELSRPSASTVKYVCPDNHERWLYDSRSQQWQQMY